MGGRSSLGGTTAARHAMDSSRPTKPSFSRLRDLQREFMHVRWEAIKDRKGGWDLWDRTRCRRLLKKLPTKAPSFSQRMHFTARTSIQWSSRTHSATKVTIQLLALTRRPLDQGATICLRMRLAPRPCCRRAFYSWTRCRVVYFLVGASLATSVTA